MQGKESIKAIFISFARGVASIGGVSGPINPYEGLNPKDADTRALKSDWKAVGGDLRTAINKMTSEIDDVHPS